eukprot:Nitzschia sp. Nitz4//scaffold8_size234185//67504//75292//NITZ4_001248-RA/size234185-processed-gene-0.151-mRNA-1//-1//CDS//3329559779//3937//frame0
MPMNMPPTMAEREAELAALQSAFDEYIASSRELEEELDAELAKMQEKLADSSAANAALSAQLENIAPQLAALEKALSESRSKLKEEQKWRRTAEQAQDELEAKFREAEGSLIAVKEECDAVHEELAFKESELEETRLELEIERERHRVEMEDALAGAPPAGSETVKTDEATAKDSTPTVDDAYVKKLEDELELVTEQLIETESRLSQTEDKLSNLEAKNSDNDMDKLLSDVGAVDSEKDKELIRVLQEENAQRLEEEHKLREELELTKEELTLTQEELKAVEFDAQEVTSKMDKVRADHREELNNLRSMLQNTESDAKTSGAEAEAISKTLGVAAEEHAALKEEIENLNYALMNAKKDHETAVEELEAVNQRFDLAMEEAEKRGRESATVDVRSEFETERGGEIGELKAQLAKLAAENAELQGKIDDAEMSLALAKDSQTRNVEGAEVQTELVKQLQTQLKRSKEDLSKKEADMGVLVSKLESRVTKAEENVTKLEQELSVTKGKLAEAEAGLIVSKREKEIAESKDISKSMARSRSRRSVAGRSSSGTSIFNPELDNMDEKSTVTRRRRIRSNSPNSYKRLELLLGDEKKKMKELQGELDKAKEQKRMSENHVKRLEEDLKVLQRQLFSSGETGVSTQMSRLSSLASGGGGATDILSDDGQSKIEEIIAGGDSALMGAELRTLEKKCNAQRDYNNQLLSKMLALQGNIQVFCRIRPMSFNEIQKGCKSVVEALSETELGCFDARTNQWKSFAFDRVWGPDQSQQSVFQDVEPIALSVVDGFNACIFAYGQTGSGKTFTMEGVEKDNQRGISYRTIQKLFHLLNIKKQQEATAAILLKTQEEREEEPTQFSFGIEIGMLEIYNDECYDLLESHGSSVEQKKRDAVAHGGKASLDIRRNKEGRIEVPNLTKEPVNSLEDVIALLKKGNSNRATAATSMNEHSSRSHMVLWVDVTSGFEGQPGNKGTLFLVDLAGSERVKKSEVAGDHLKEAGHINKSLAALGNVMEALDRKASHVPYRDSKLTYLLQDSLGGNSRTMMVVAVTPIDMSYDESIHALQFATRVRRINIGAAQRNVTSKNLEETVKELTAEMKKLSMQKAKTDSQLNSLKKDNARVQDKLSKISDARKNDKSDSKTLEVLRKNNNEMARRWEKEKSLREETAEELDKARAELSKLQKEVNKYSRESEMFAQKMEEKERLLERRTTELRAAKEASSAANLRARKAQVLGGRVSRPAPAKPVAPAGGKSVSSRSTNSGTTGSGSSVTSGAASTVASEDVSEIRGKVLELLEKHDKAKVNRIDIIMEKFKGKESLLLDKMTQRYEGGGDNETAASSAGGDDAKTRSQLAAERHMERMRKLRESKGNQQPFQATIPTQQQQKLWTKPTDGVEKRISTDGTADFTLESVILNLETAAQFNQGKGGSQRNKKMWDVSFVRQTVEQYEHCLAYLHQERFGVEPGVAPVAPVGGSPESQEVLLSAETTERAFRAMLRCRVPTALLSTKVREWERHIGSLGLTPLTDTLSLRMLEANGKAGNVGRAITLLQARKARGYQPTPKEFVYAINAIDSAGLYLRIHRNVFLSDKDQPQIDDPTRWLDAILINMSQREFPLTTRIANRMLNTYASTGKSGKAVHHFYRVLRKPTSEDDSSSVEEADANGKTATFHQRPVQVRMNMRPPPPYHKIPSQVRGKLVRKPGSEVKQLKLDRETDPDWSLPLTSAFSFADSLTQGACGHDPIPLDLVSYSTLIKACVCRGSLWRAMHIIDEVMPANDIKPDAVAYNTLLWGLALVGDAPTMKDYFGKMSANGVEPTKETVAAIVQGLLNLGDIPTAISVVQDCFNQYSVVPPYTTHLKILEFALARGLVYEAKRHVFVIQQLRKWERNDYHTEEFARVMELTKKNPKLSNEALQQLFAYFGETLKDKMSPQTEDKTSSLYDEEYTPPFFPVLALAFPIMPLFWKYHVIVTDNVLSFGYSYGVVAKSVQRKEVTITAEPFEISPLTQWGGWGIRLRFGKYQWGYIAQGGPGVHVCITDAEGNKSEYVFSCANPEKVCTILNGMV